MGNTSVSVMYMHLGQIMARGNFINNKLEVGNEVNVVSIHQQS